MNFPSSPHSLVRLGSKIDDLLRTGLRRVRADYVVELGKLLLMLTPRLLSTDFRLVPKSARAIL